MSTAAAAAAVAQAIKASGAIVSLAPEEFQKLLHRIDDPAVVQAPAGLTGKQFQYLTSWRGLILHTRSRTRLHLPGGTELIAAKSIWIP